MLKATCSAIKTILEWVNWAAAEHLLGTEDQQAASSFVLVVFSTHQALQVLLPRTTHHQLAATPQSTVEVLMLILFPGIRLVIVNNYH